MSFIDALRVNTAEKNSFQFFLLKNQTLPVFKRPIISVGSERAEKTHTHTHKENIISARC